MATGTGKTYTAFKLSGDFLESQSQKRILFLADAKYSGRSNQDLNDFQPFGTAMTKITGREF
ncbi:DEAD/DEAH box helicase family protein [Vibrio chagasii]|nr:DEAD/DEAH box helicase family protein [Vibrio chagasii]